MRTKTSVTDNDINMETLDPTTIPAVMPFPITEAMTGSHAIVPMEWLTKLLTQGQVQTLVQRRATRRSRTRRGKGIYRATPFALKRTVRGPERVQKVFGFIKEHPEGVTTKQLRASLKLTQQHVWHALKALEGKRAVSFHTAA